MNDNAKNIEMQIEVSGIDQEEQRRRIMAYIERIAACVRVRDADMTKMAELVERMRGPSRSYNQYAKAMEVAPSSVTRIVKQEAAKVSNELLAKLADNMDPDCGVTIEELIAANGLEENRRRVAIIAAKEFEKKAEEIIRNDLYRGGKMVMKADSEYQRVGFGRIGADVIIQTDAVDGKDRTDGLWAFTIRYFSKEERRDDNIRINDYNFAAMRITEFISAIMSEFYCGTELGKWSIVMNRREVFEKTVERIERRLGSRKIKDRISLILVDSEKEYVSKEWIIPTEATVIEAFPLEPEDLKEDRQGDLYHDDMQQMFDNRWEEDE